MRDHNLIVKAPMNTSNVDGTTQAVKALVALEEATAARAARLRHIVGSLENAQIDGADLQLRHFAGSHPSAPRGGGRSQTEDMGRTMATTSQMIGM